MAGTQGSGRRRAGGNEKIFSRPWTGLGARKKVLLRLSKWPVPKVKEPPTDFRPLMPSICM